MKTKAIKKEEIKKLIMDGLSVNDLAITYNVSKTTIGRKLREFNLKFIEIKREKMPIELTTNQLDVITGSLLGDGCLYKSNERSKNYLYKLKQKTDRAMYIEYLSDIFHEYNTKIKNGKSRKPSKINGKINHDIAHWDGMYLYNTYLYTSCHPIFTRLYKKWYPNNFKVVPSDIKLNPIILSHWYMEDGSNNVTKNSKGLFLYTNAFSEKEVLFLKDRLFIDLSIESQIYNYKESFILRVGAKNYFDFIDLVSPHIVSCFKYKIDISKAPKNRKGKGWYGKKLNMTIANNIRRLYERNDLKLKELAIEYDVSVSTISKIINNQLYKSGLRFNGEAICNYTTY